MWHTQRYTHMQYRIKGTDSEWNKVKKQFPIVHKYLKSSKWGKGKSYSAYRVWKIGNRREVIFTSLFYIFYQNTCIRSENWNMMWAMTTRKKTLMTSALAGKEETVPLHYLNRQNLCLPAKIKLEGEWSLGKIMMLHVTKF